MYVPNPSGNPYGPPVPYAKAVELSGGAIRPLHELMPVGTKMRVRVGLLQGKIVDHVCLAAWPTTSEAPPKGDPDVDPGIIADEVHAFLRASDRLESLVVADFNGLSDQNLQPARAEVREVFDDNFGLAEVIVRGRDRREGDAFAALFHREDLYLRDGKRAVENEFFRDKKLADMVRKKDSVIQGGQV